MKKIKIGIQLYSVRGDMERDMEGTLAKVAAMGYEYVEFAGYYGRTSAEIKALLDKYGLKCISVHQGIEMFEPDPKPGIDFLKGFGVKYVVIPWYDGRKLAEKSEWAKTAAKFSALARVLGENGMKLLYHNHDFEFKKLPEGGTIHDRMFRDLPEMDPQLDTCWVHYAGINPAELIARYAGHVEVVHLKDFVCKNLAAGPVYALIDAEGKAAGGSQTDTGFEYRPLGMGIQNLDEILEACEKAGTEYLIVEQDDSVDRPPMEAIALCREYLKSKGL